MIAMLFSLIGYEFNFYLNISVFYSNLYIYIILKYILHYNR